MRANRMQSLLDRLQCRLPLVLAGMGGVARAELCAAVSNAGGFGLLGMVRESPQMIAYQIEQVRHLTDRPFGVSLIPYATDASLLDAEVAVCIEAAVPAVCLFWSVDKALVARLKNAGITVLYQIGTIDAALEAVEAGTDVVIAQGVEAGGHVHGSMARDALLGAVCNQVAVSNPAVPVLAAGGIGCAADLRHVLGLGAAGALLGSALLATTESNAHDCHKQALIDGCGSDTLVTDRFFINWPPGSMVRVLPNSVTRGPEPARDVREPIAREDQRPILRYGTDSPLRETVGILEPLPHYAGTGIDNVTRVRPAAEVIREIASGCAS